MAPEHPPELVIFDATFEGEKLKGDLHYVEVPVGNRLRVVWDTEGEPENFKSVGGGVAYVFKTDKLQDLRVSRNSIPDHLGGLQYKWSQGLNEGIQWFMFILILPSGHTLAAAEPKPARAKLFKSAAKETADSKDRLAVYWILKGDGLGRTQVVCTLSSFEGNPSSKLIELNRFCSGENLSGNGLIQIEVRTPDAVDIWREKLAFLQQQEAVAADPGQKFALKKQIAEARTKIQEFGGFFQ